MENSKDYSSEFKGIWIPLNILTNENLTKPELLVLSIILHLDNEKGCYATNRYFAKVLKLSRGRISEIINDLLAKDFINCCIDQSLGNNRIIKVNTSILKEVHPIPESINTYSRKEVHPIPEKAKHNNKDYNKGNKKSESERTPFDFLNENFTEDILKIKKDYRLPPKEWNFCTNKFNAKTLGKNELNVTTFETFVSNWNNNYKKNKLEEPIKLPYLRKFS